MIKEAIVKIVQKKTLSFDESYLVMNEIMNGLTSPTQISAFLTALATRSEQAESIEEISGFATSMREHSLKVNPTESVFEIVGTGGDNAGSFNISTTSAIVVASGGMKVAKHGNTAASSKCGSADCLSALGVNIRQSPTRCVTLLKETGICFFFAQMYHSSMKYVGAIRKELGFRTVFNILGPLTNPANPSRQLLGVYDISLLNTMASVLSNLGVKRGMVVFGQEKLDEISICAPTSVCEINDGVLNSYVITPDDYGIKRRQREDLLGGTPEENAKITLGILNGVKGPKRDAVLINSGASFFIGGKVSSIQEGINLASELIDSGKALETLNKFIEYSNQQAEVESVCS